jgi:methyltransferase (TIGR00027 family)
LQQPPEQYITDLDVFGLVWLMLVRTRILDERVVRAVEEGAQQLVILGAGFDSRAERFAPTLTGVKVFEVDHPLTQKYKQRRVEAALGHSTANVVYAPVDFERDRLGEALRAAGFDAGSKSCFLCEGLSMYVAEPGFQETLRVIAGESAPGSKLILEYMNRNAIEVLMNHPSGMVKYATQWGEPFVFGVPDGQDEKYFLDAGLVRGDAQKLISPESAMRYTLRADGSRYGSHLDQAFQQRQKAAEQATDEAGRAQAAQWGAMASYWLAELSVPSRLPA